MMDLGGPRTTKFFGVCRISLRRSEKFDAVNRMSPSYPRRGFSMTLLYGLLGLLLFVYVGVPLLVLTTQKVTRSVQASAIAPEAVPPDVGEYFRDTGAALE